MAWVVKVNGTIEAVPNTDIGTLMYWVGGWVKQIKLQHGLTGYVNEDAARIGLEFNPTATELFGLGPITGYLVVANHNIVNWKGGTA